MKAIIQHKYGGPEVMTYAEIEQPKPKPNEVLVKVYSSSINPLDWHFMRGTPYFMRLIVGLFRPKSKVIGADLAGIVEEVGSDVKRLKKGDRVFGGHRVGAYAEYCIALEEKLAIMPDELSFKDAAAIPIAGITALQALRQYGDVKKGDEVLINGASGGVGTFGVQLAKHFGAEVTAVCSTQKVEQAKRLGATTVIDYRNEDCLKTEKRFDFIMDNVGNKTPAQWKSLLKPEGLAGIVGYTSLGLLIRHGFGGKKIKTINTGKTIADLEFIADLIVNEVVIVEHDREYELEKLPEALAYVEEGHASGKVTILNHKN